MRVAYDESSLISNQPSTVECDCGAWVCVQVSVGLSHAAILEESVRARDLLMQQNVALDHARAEAEKAIRARNDFLAVMNHEMRTPMHAIIALSTLLQVRLRDPHTTDKKRKKKNVW